MSIWTFLRHAVFMVIAGLLVAMGYGFLTWQYWVMAAMVLLVQLSSQNEK